MEQAQLKRLKESRKFLIEKIGPNSTTDTMWMRDRLDDVEREIEELEQKKLISPDGK